MTLVTEGRQVFLSSHPLCQVSAPVPIRLNSNLLQIQCDGGLPQCNFCFHHDVACTFNRILVPRKRTPKVRYVLIRTSKGPSSQYTPRRLIHKSIRALTFVT